MNRKNSITARILAALALVGTVALILFVISSETGNGTDTGDGKGSNTGQGKNANGGNGNSQQPKPTKKVYVVQEGDTLTVIAAENGVTVEKIERLNPDLDPQALIPGQKLKLR